MSLYAGFAPVEIAYRQQYLHHLADRTSHPDRRRPRPRPRPHPVTATEPAPVRN